MTQKYGQYYPLGISLGLHVLVLAILAFYVIKPMPAAKWYEFSFSEPEPAVRMPSLATEELDVTPGVPVRRETTGPREAKRPSEPTSPPSSNRVPDTQNQPLTRESELIETPAVTLPDRQPLPSQGKNPLAMKALTSQLSGIPSPGSQGSLEHQVAGGKLSFSVRSGYKLKHTDFGVVVLTFRVDQNAQLIASSISAVPPVDMKFLGEATQILKEGSMRFQGKPDPGAVYQITFTFNLKNREGR
jgi:hypothetical protein